MKENDAPAPEKREVHEARDHFITDAMASRGRTRMNPRRRLFRTAAVLLFAALVGLIMAPLLFAALLWLAAFFQ